MTRRMASLSIVESASNSIWLIRPMAWQKMLIPCKNIRMNKSWMTGSHLSLQTLTILKSNCRLTRAPLRNLMCLHFLNDRDSRVKRKEKALRRPTNLNLLSKTFQTDKLITKSICCGTTTHLFRTIFRKRMNRANAWWMLRPIVTTFWLRRSTWTTKTWISDLS